jgi:hypothetical protein
MEVTAKFVEDAWVDQEPQSSFTLTTVRTRLETVALESVQEVAVSSVPTV